jgi:uncharacterized protein
MTKDPCGQRLTKGAKEIKDRQEKQVISEALMEVVHSEFALNLNGIHGVSHWQRVCDNGLRLAELTGANTDVVEFFAFLHDSKRLSDGWDREHGQRAAEFIKTLRGSLVDLSDEEFELLAFACAYHSDGLTEGDITVQTCWDADRLDLGRIGIKPNERYLCTPAAKDPATIEWAYARSLRWRTNDQ